MSKKLLGTYVNGNYNVSIFEDGTKVRWNNEDNLTAAFPESIDIRITNACDRMCRMCHEQSTPDGKHGDLSDPILNSLRPFTEIAIGGGNPLEHPGLIDFLQRMKDRKVICNLTVNLEHFLKHYDALLSWANRNLIHGLGVSVGRVVTAHEAELITEFPNSVAHVIAGLADVDLLSSLANHNIRLLILGYKLVGRGANYYEQAWKSIEDNIRDLELMLMDVWKPAFKLISFDNLAVEQLEIEKQVDPEVWKRCYMGDDGQYTMYLDLVERKYAVASTKERFPIPEDIETIDELFAIVKQKASEEDG